MNTFKPYSTLTILGAILLPFVTNPKPTLKRGLSNAIRIEAYRCRKSDTRHVTLRTILKII